MSTNQFNSIIQQYENKNSINPCPAAHDCDAGGVGAGDTQPRGRRHPGLALSHRQHDGLEQPLGSCQRPRQSVPLDIQIMDGAENFLERRIDNLRTEHRNSLLGAECGDANSARSKKRVGNLEVMTTSMVLRFVLGEVTARCKSYEGSP